MRRGPSRLEMRARVRTLETWALLLIAGGLQNLEFAGSPPEDAVTRFKTVQEEVSAELERRGIVVAPNPELVAVATYCGEIFRERSEL
jgi:hypothetical protein